MEKNVTWHNAQAWNYEYIFNNISQTWGYDKILLDDYAFAFKLNQGIYRISGQITYTVDSDDRFEMMLRLCGKNFVTCTSHNSYTWTSLPFDFMLNVTDATELFETRVVVSSAYTTDTPIEYTLKNGTQLIIERLE